MAIQCPKCHSDNTDTARFCSNCAISLTSAELVSPPLTQTLESPVILIPRGTVYAGHYEILGHLGAGGMGEVYRAVDRNLGRDVAIKVLPASFAEDKERMARFEREARLLAALNHPHIAAIHGLEESGGKRFLVLELVEGETLRARLERGSLSAEEALKIALQLAEGLEAAHEKGIIHRDLKPGNVMLTPDVKVKILDFGLAKVYSAEATDIDIAKSPTITGQMTEPGVILGTAAYMSPEQVRGRAADRRADIWAFGCVLFEMLTRRAAFPGKDTTEILAAVIRAEPEWTSLPTNLHGRLREVIERCLKKDLRDRYHDISDVRADLQRVLSDPSGVLTQPVPIVSLQKKLRLGLPWVAGVAVLGGILGGLAGWNLRKPEARQVVRFDYLLPEGQQLSNALSRILAISPDGRHIAYSTPQGLYLRSMDEKVAKLISGTEGESIEPFFSPDGQWIGYFSSADGELKKIPARGGAPVVLCAAREVLGASWREDETIVFGQPPNEIMRISAGGGSPESLAKLKTGYFIVLPQLLPGGRSVLYTSLEAGGGLIRAQPLKAGEAKDLFKGYGAQYLPTGHIVYILNDNILAVRFDPDRLEVIGGPVSVVEGASDIAVSDSGTLAYLPQAFPEIPYNRRTLVWVDREGKEEAIAAEPGTYITPRISPDGKRIALSVQVRDKVDIWTWDLSRRSLTKLTFDDGAEVSPLWTPDGRRVAFFSKGADRLGVYWKAADGTGKDEFFGGGDYPASWSADGKTLVLMEWNAESMNYDIAVLPLEGDRKLGVLLKEKHNEAQPRISPDGRWMAYMSDESGRNQVYVRPFPEVDGGRWQVSTSGGDSPLWSPDGRELLFRNGDAVMSAPIETDPAFSPGMPKRLFQGTYANSELWYDSWDWAAWDISPDGRRFLMMKETGLAASGRVRSRKITVVLNWFEELKRRMPAK
jgi:serine/threonine protein kinase/dipeptidyl aminopeptidase/acylaminoacyl peptidase